MKNALAVAMGAAALAIGPLQPIDAQQGAAAGACRISGRATSGATPLPGVTVTAAGGRRRQGRDLDRSGRHLSRQPAGRHLSARRRADRLRRASNGTSLSPTRPARRPSICSWRSRPRVPVAPAPAVAAAANRGRAAAGAQPAAHAGRARRGARAGATTAGRGQRFETLAVQTQAGAAAGLEVNPPERESEAAAMLLPPGFSTEGPTQAVSINGNMASLDRGMMSDRLEAIGRGEFDPATGEFAQGFGGGRAARAGGSAGPEADGRVRRTRAARAAARRAGRARRARRARRLRPRRPRRAAERLLVHQQLHLRRLGARQRALSAARQLTGHPAALHPPELRRHGRRPAQDPARLRRHAAHQLHAHLQRAAAARTCSISTPPSRPTRCAPATSRPPA